MVKDGRLASQGTRRRSELLTRLIAHWKALQVLASRENAQSRTGLRRRKLGRKVQGCHDAAKRNAADTWQEKQKGR
jgi:hypothetical protein